MVLCAILYAVNASADEPEKSRWQVGVHAVW